MKEAYFLRNWDGVKTLAKVEEAIGYVYNPMEKKWEENQNVAAKIMFDISDYEEISEEEAKKVMKELEEENN